MRNMCKYLFFLLLVFIAFNLEAQSDYVTKSDAKVRKGPGAKYKLLGVIKMGMTITVTDTSNSSWYKIEYGGNTAYLSSKLLTPVVKEVQMPIPSSEEIVGTATKGTSPYTIMVIVIFILVFVVISSKSKKKKVVPEKEMIYQIRKPVVQQRGAPKFEPQKEDGVLTKDETELAAVKVNEINKPSIPITLTIEMNGKVVEEIIYVQHKNSRSSNYENDIEAEPVIDVSEETYVLPKYFSESVSTPQVSNPGYDNPFQYWGLGTRYKSKLQLTDVEVKVLNELIDTDNKFNGIEFIAIELIRLFFDTINHLKDEFKKTGSSLEEQVNLIAEIELTQRYRLWKNSNSYMAQLPAFTATINQVIYKMGENSLREHFNIGRKTALQYYISNDGLSEFNKRLYQPIETYIGKRLPELKGCDDTTEIELNDYTKTRWKVKLELLKSKCETEDITSFYNEVVQLGKQNIQNPSVEHIFFEASKYVTKFDKETALKLYVHYIYYDLQSATFDNKQLAKTIQKSLFTNSQQLKDFELIINALIADKNVEKAIAEVPTLYKPKRKKIQLDVSKIKEVQEKHSDTVELLNEYLQEEEELHVAEKTLANKDGEISLAIDYGVIEQTSSIYKHHHLLSAIQEETLNLFSKRGFTIPISEFDGFVKSKGSFKNSLIESINEIYFETLDDVLIEEDDDSIYLSETYYSKIIN